MKCITLATILLVASLGAVEVTVLGGGNYQSQLEYFPTNVEEYSSGISFHGGGLAVIGFSPFKIPFRLCMETGFIYQHSYYDLGFVHIDGYPQSFSANLYEEFYNLVFPFNIKAVIQPWSSLRFGLGTGIAYRYSLSGRKWREILSWTGGDTPPSSEERLFTSDSLNSCLGWIVKAEAGYRIYMRLWLTPVFSAVFYPAWEYEYDFFDDYDVKTRQATCLVSLGLAYEF